MDIKIYTTPNCPYCKAAKIFLQDIGFAFEDIDVSANQTKAQEMIEKSGQMGVPVIEVDGQIIIGFDRARLIQSLNLSKGG